MNGNRWIININITDTQSLTSIIRLLEMLRWTINNLLTTATGSNKLRLIIKLNTEMKQRLIIRLNTDEKQRLIIRLIQIRNKG